MAENIHAKLAAEQEKYGNHFTKEELDQELEAAAQRKAAIDQRKSDLAGQEVAFSKAIAEDVKKRNEEDDPSDESRLTKEDIQNDLDAAAARKKAIDDAKAAKAGEDYKHVKEVVEQRKKSVEVLQSESQKLDEQLKALEEKQTALQARSGVGSA